jgi:hypothetical protein
LDHSVVVFARAARDWLLPAPACCNGSAAGRWTSDEDEDEDEERRGQSSFGK